MNSAQTDPKANNQCPKIPPGLRAKRRNSKKKLPKIPPYPIPQILQIGAVLLLAWVISSPASEPAFKVMQGTDFSSIQRLAQKDQNMGAYGVLSLYHRYGYGIPQNFFIAASVIPPKAAEHPFSLYNMAVLINNRIASLEDDDERRLQLKNQAEVLAQRAIPGLEDLANQGDPFAQLFLGGCYENGLGVPKDTNKAFDFYLSASTAGLAVAWPNLASILKNKTHDTQHYDYITLYELAAKEGVTSAKYHLAQSYLKGIILPKNPKKAIQILQEIANQNNYSTAQADLAKYYFTGKFVEKNDELGKKYLKMAAINNSPTGVKMARNLGYRVDVTLDFPESFKLALSRSAKPINFSPILPDILQENQFSRDNISPDAHPSTLLLENISGASPPQSKPTKAFLDFHKTYIAKSETIFRYMQDAIIKALDSGSLSTSSIFNDLEPTSGKAVNWLENAFAAETLLLKEQPNWIEFLGEDRTLALSVADLPAQLIPLLKENKLTSTNRLLTSWPSQFPNASPDIKNAWNSAFQSLITKLQERIDISESLRQKSQHFLEQGILDAALQNFQQAIKADLRPTDNDELEKIKNQIKHRDFENIGL